MDQRTQLAIARKVIADFNSRKSACDSLAKAPRIAEVHAVSRTIKESRERATVSINDILDAYACTAMLEDPAMRDRLRAVSATLNRG